MSEYYDYMLPTVNFMGAGCVEVVGERCKILGAEKVLLVTDNYLNSLESGPVQIVGDYLKKAGLEYVVFDGVTPNFKDKDVYAGLEIYEKETLKYLKTRLFRVNSTIRPEAGIKT